MVMTWRYFNTEGWFFALSAVSAAAGRTLHLNSESRILPQHLCPPGYLGFSLPCLY